MKPTPIACARWLAAVVIDATPEPVTRADAGTQLEAWDVGVRVQRGTRRVLVPWSNVRQVDLT